MKLITLHFSEPYLRGLDRLARERLYPNKSEAIRVAVRGLLTADGLQVKRRSKP